MCYAIPAKLIKILKKKKHKIGIIDYFGEERQVIIDIDDLKVGDYVYAQGGVLIRKVPTKEALEILEYWKDIFFQLKQTDEALSKVDQDKLPPNALAILQKVNLRKSLKRDEMLTLLGLTQKEELAVLNEIANNVRQQQHGNSSCIHGVIEFSNYCRNSCFYCGIRCEQNIQRYRMSVEEIIAAAKEAVEKYGFKALVLQSGEDLWYDDAMLEKIVTEVRALGILVCLSIGSRDIETYRKLYAAGARAALIRFETSNAEIFAKLRPGTNLQDRIKLIDDVRELGFVLATGFILGLPGETHEDIANNILLTKYFNPDMYTFGPLIPTQDTPLANCSQITKDLVLKATAITRFVDANSNILVTTASETLDKSLRKEALLAGANSMMINVTPAQYRNLYSIYDNKTEDSFDVAQCIKESIDLLMSLGRCPTDLGIS